LLAVAGLFALCSPFIFELNVSINRVLIVGLTSLLIGIILICSYEGIFIDFQRLQFIHYFSFFGFKFGQWEAISKITKIKVLSIEGKSTNTPNAISPTITYSFKEHNIFIYSEDQSNPLFTFPYSKRKKAIKKANELAALFGVSMEIVEQ